jgi:hypothetical protein
MQNIPQQPPYPPPGPAPLPKSNKKLWIILGSIIGVLLIIMGGCAACGLLVGLSALNDAGSSSNSPAPRSTDEQQAPAPAPRTAPDDSSLAGTWQGTVKCDTGEELPAVFKVSESGNPVYEYQTKSGAREAELTAEGQTFRFVPPGGGVTSVEVNSLSVSPERIGYSMSISSERSGGGTLEQSGATTVTEAARAGAALDVKLTIQSRSTLSQPGIVVPGEGSTTVCRGTLRRE